MLTLVTCQPNYKQPCIIFQVIYFAIQSTKQITLERTPVISMLFVK